MAAVKRRLKMHEEFSNGMKYKESVLPLFCNISYLIASLLML